MARTRWPPICETPASGTGQADRTGSAGGCLNDRDPADGPVSRQPARRQAGWQVRPGPSPTLRPYPRKTTEAGPKLLSTSSLPNIRASAVGRGQCREDTEQPALDLFARLTFIGSVGSRLGSVLRQPPGLAYGPSTTITRCACQVMNRIVLTATGSAFAAPCLIPPGVVCHTV